MYAIIRNGGHQYKVEEGDMLTTFRKGGDVSELVEFDEVLLVSTEDGVKVGHPTVAEAKVVGQIVAHDRGEKIDVLTFRRRKGRHRKIGHRDQLTRIRIKEIVAP